MSGRQQPSTPEPAAHHSSIFVQSYCATPYCPLSTTFVAMFRPAARLSPFQPPPVLFQNYQSKLFQYKQLLVHSFGIFQPPLQTAVAAINRIPSYLAPQPLCALQHHPCCCSLVAKLTDSGTPTAPRRCWSFIHFR